ncbi:hypothetical protein [Chitinophaga sp. Cy-1792]|uniref:lipase family protein n=1 Tax=Chitinophaga sp. Cy-1792 TaxID=2608339 RepID=UPI00141FBA14|nr:hypothetical protein [Chitinophaga sp. Cy-1792]NIG56674.1 hypothetical protein [Chitinophaga sp. Cy-1792]
MDHTTTAAAQVIRATTEETLRITLEIIAGQANVYGMVDNGPSLPGGYRVQTKFSSEKAPSTDMPVIPTQGYLVTKSINGVDTDVLTLGCTWVRYFQYQYDGEWLLDSLVKDIAGNPPASAQLMKLYVKAYNYLRKPLWESLKLHSEKNPLYICGHGLGAPLAQIAALDLRTGNRGPQDAGGIQPVAPSPTPACYTFSTAGYANDAFKDYFNKTVTGAVNAIRANRNTNVDQWPDSDEGFVVPGNNISIDASLVATADDPWWERATTFYTQTLGGKPLPNAPESPDIYPKPLPALFSQDFAFSAAKMCMFLYHKVQHPDGSDGTPPSGYTYKDKLLYAGDAWGFIFTNDFNNSVVVAFRGAINFSEFNTYAALSGLSGTPWNTNPSAHVHEGALAIYDGFRAKLKTTLQSADYSGRDIYFTGHDFGGVLANIAASEYEMTPIRAIKAVYTFGAPMTMDYTFAQAFKEKLGSKSFQINRTNDDIPYYGSALGFFAIDTMDLRGAMSLEEPDYHSLFNYQNLLDTSKNAW